MRSEAGLAQGRRARLVLTDKLLLLHLPELAESFPGLYQEHVKASSSRYSVHLCRNGIYPDLPSI